MPMTAKFAYTAATTIMCVFAAIGILLSVVFIAWIISILSNIHFAIVLGGELLVLVSITKLVYDAVKIEDLNMDWDDEDLEV